jgi:hypothetical protein
MKPKPCKLCTVGKARLDEKYCPRCRNNMRNMMDDSGCLTDASEARKLSEQRARSQRHSNTVGGSAELNSDGDE